MRFNSSANVFVFGDFNVHHKDWLTYFGGTDRSDELCYNFSISNDLTQIVNFPTWIPDCDSHSPAFLDLFLFSDTSILSTMAFPLLENSDHAVVSVFIEFPINSKQDASFHGLACAIWVMFHGRISLNSVTLLLLVNFVSGFRLELMYISLIISS